jgi:RNA polymerase sigma-70 factor (ECF subfamily)
MLIIDAMHTTSVSLLDQLRQPTGQESWSRFVKLYTPLLFFWARKLGLRDADAAELVQEIFVVLVQKLPAFEYERQKGFRNWLRTVLLNKWRNSLRKKANARLAGGEIDLAEVADSAEEDVLAETEYRQHLMSHAMELMRSEFPLKTWKACWEHVVMDRPAAEVAAELGIVVGAVYVAKSRVLARLRQELIGLLD